MSEYAEDIRSAAINLADTLILEREVSGQSPDYTKWAYMMCAQALMARDERAARIADEQASLWTEEEAKTLYGQAYCRSAKNIAAAIRTQKEN